MVKKGKIKITPFFKEQVTTNSYDLKLSDDIITYNENILDTKIKNNYQAIKISSSGYLLKAKNLYLASSKEKIGSNHFVPIIHAKFRIARLGLFVHITADIINIGYCGKLLFIYTPLMILLFIQIWE